MDTEDAGKQPGIYVIEFAHGRIKVGMSADVPGRLAFHYRNARSLGLDPYRHVVFDVPFPMLREAEKAAHRALRDAGADTAPGSTEVFTGIFFNPAVDLVRPAVEALVALDELRQCTPNRLNAHLGNASQEVRLVLSHALLRL